MFHSSDPVAAGLVSSLSRRGENVIGVSMAGAEFAPQQLERLREGLPTLTSVGRLDVILTDYRATSRAK
jgi:ABC-type uncharacterized transport system substrate-binding protein